MVLPHRVSFFLLPRERAASNEYPEQPFDAFASIDRFLNGDLVLCAFLEKSARADVKAFSILPNDQKIYIIRPFVSYRGLDSGV